MGWRRVGRSTSTCSVASCPAGSVSARRSRTGYACCAQRNTTSSRYRARPACPGQLMRTRDMRLQQGTADQASLHAGLLRSVVHAQRDRRARTRHCVRPQHEMVHPGEEHEEDERHDVCAVEHLRAQAATA